MKILLFVIILIIISCMSIILKDKILFLNQNLFELHIFLLILFTLVMHVYIHKYIIERRNKIEELKLIRKKEILTTVVDETKETAKSFILGKVFDIIKNKF